MKHGLYACRHNDLKDTEAFQILIIVSLFCAWNITTVEINSGVYLLKSKIRQVPLFHEDDIGLVILVLIVHHHHHRYF